MASRPPLPLNPYSSRTEYRDRKQGRYLEGSKRTLRALVGFDPVGHNDPCEFRNFSSLSSSLSAVPLTLCLSDLLSPRRGGVFGVNCKGITSPAPPRTYTMWFWVPAFIAFVYVPNGYLPSSHIPATSRYTGPSNTQRTAPHFTVLIPTPTRAGENPTSGTYPSNLGVPVLFPCSGTKRAGWHGGMMDSFPSTRLQSSLNHPHRGPFLGPPLPWALPSPSTLNATYVMT